MTVKACPICNKKTELNITPRNRYERCLANTETKGACICIQCWNCHLALTEHSDIDYDKLLSKLINRWNDMPRKENIDDGK